MPWWTSSSGHVELKLLMKHAREVHHPGDCEPDVLRVMQLPYVRRQLERVDSKKLRDELRGYGGWEEEELQDHQENLKRLVWIAGCDIAEGSV